MIHLGVRFWISIRSSVWDFVIHYFSHLNVTFNLPHSSSYSSFLTPVFLPGISRLDILEKTAYPVEVIQIEDPRLVETPIAARRRVNHPMYPAPH